MSMVFGFCAIAAIEEDPSLREAISREKGEVTRPVNRAEMNERLVNGETGGKLIPSEFIGYRIDLKPGAFTTEEIEEIKSGELGLLSYQEGYGTKWRIWEGWPTDEQMAAEPWEG